MSDSDQDVVFDKVQLLSNSRIKVSSDGYRGGGRLLTTLGLCAAFIGLGLYIAMIGPAVIPLGMQFEDYHINSTGSDSQEDDTKSSMTTVFVFRAVGYLVGCAAGGFLFDYINQTCMLSVALFISAAPIVSVLFLNDIRYMDTITAILGACMGMIDTGGNLLCLYTWGRRSGPYMQLMHFAYGLGAFVAPLLAKSFVPVSNGTLSPPMVINGTGLFGPFHPQWEYLIIGLYNLLVALLFLLVCFRGKLCLKPMQDAGLEPKYIVNKGTENTGFRLQLLALLFIFFFLHVGVVVTFGNFITLYAYEKLEWTDGKEVYLAVVFWGCFAAGRAIAVPLAKWFNPPSLLVADMIISSIALLGLALINRDTAVWGLTAMLGLGLASVFPAGVTWAERYMHVTARSTSIFVIGSALGQFTPVVTIQLMKYNPSLFLYTMLACSIISTIQFVFMQNLATNQGERYRPVTSTGSGDTGEIEIPDLPVNNSSSSKRKKKVTFQTPANENRSSQSMLFLGGEDNKRD